MSLLYTQGRGEEQERRKKEREREAKEAADKVEACSANKGAAALAQTTLSDRERRALAAERRLGGAVTASPVGTCDLCGKAAGGAPFHRLSYNYCSTQCVIAHRAALGS